MLSLYLFSQLEKCWENSYPGTMINISRVTREFSCGWEKKNGQLHASIHRELCITAGEGEHRSNVYARSTRGYVLPRNIGWAPEECRVKTLPLERLMLRWHGGRKPTSVLNRVAWTFERRGDGIPRGLNELQRFFLNVNANDIFIFISLRSSSSRISISLIIIL